MLDNRMVYNKNMIIRNTINYIGTRGTYLISKFNYHKLINVKTLLTEMYLLKLTIIFIKIVKYVFNT